MVKEKELSCEDALIQVLSENFPISYYSIGSFQEDAICMQKKGSEWEVYVGERGQKRDLEVFSDIMSASLRVLSKLAGNAKDFTAVLYDSFLNRVIISKVA